MNTNSHTQNQKKGIKTKNHITKTLESNVSIKTLQNSVEKYSMSNITNILKNETREVMKKKDIERIDNIVQSWRYKMCVKCAMICEGNSLNDLYLSSERCKNKNHAVPKRATILKGHGKLYAAVEYINATIKQQVNEFFEAEYHAKNAIKCSNRYNDNLNTCISKLGMNLLRDIKEGKKSKASSLFTLSELMVFSNKDEITADKYKNTTKPNKQNIFFKENIK